MNPNPKQAFDASGLFPAPPRRLSDQLERIYRKLDRRALELASIQVLPVLHDRVQYSQALTLVDKELRDEFNHEYLISNALSIGVGVNQIHAAHFYRALGNAVGLQIVGTDSPNNDSLFFSTKDDARKRVTVSVSTTPQRLVSKFATDNANLVSTMRDGIIPGLSEAVQRAVATGQTPQQLATHLRALWRESGVPSRIPIAGGTRTVSTLSHARLIARDQMQKLNAALTLDRQQRAGVKRGKWRTMGDSKVRPEHAVLEGRVFNLSQGVAGVGYPGGPIGCRCRTEPVINSDEIRTRLLQGG